MSEIVFGNKLIASLGLTNLTQSIIDRDGALVAVYIAKIHNHIFKSCHPIRLNSFFAIAKEISSVLFNSYAGEDCERKIL